VKHRAKGLTLIELTVGLAIFATVGLAFLTIIAQIVVLDKESAGKQEAMDRAIESVENVLNFVGSNSQLHTTFHAPPDVIVIDSDGDESFDTGLAQVTVREEYPCSRSATPLQVEMVIWKAER
jgi:type II secretory pathway component PulJ